jgi:hypothetical protein
MWTESAKGTTKDLHWIGAETDHALLLKRPVQLFVEEGADLKDIVAGFSEDYPRLSPAVGRIEEKERTGTLLQQFDKITNSFRYEGESVLDGNARDSVDNAISAAQETLGRELIFGFLAQLAESDQVIIGEVLELTQYGMKKQELARKLASKDRDRRGIKGLPSLKDEDNVWRAFQRAWQKVTKRSLRIGDEQIGLITQKNHVYSSNLDKILSKLRPNVSAHSIQEQRKEILRYILGDRPAALQRAVGSAIRSPKVSRHPS